MIFNMKSACMFRDQVNTVSGWFQNWNSCEQTVALCSFVKKVSPPQAKFLLQILEQNLTGCTELQILVDKSNNPEFIRSLCNESKEDAVQHLLTYLPLLKPGNMEAKAEYLQILPKILAHSIEHGVHIEESRQLLSYSLIHPAISGEERAQFTLWLTRLEESFAFSIYQAKFSQSNVQEISQCMQYMDNENSLAALQGSHPSGWDQVGSRDSGIVSNGSESGSMLSLNNFNLKVGNGAQNVKGHTPLHSTVSAPPGLGTVPCSESTLLNSPSHPCLRQTNSSPMTLGAPTSSGSNSWLTAGDMRMGKSPDYASLSPQSSVSSGSGSESHQDENPQPKISFLEEGTGMRDVPSWLKSLRLHKYAFLFQHLSYEKMLDISEEWLESQNVTKGARNKIILSIKKLRERQDTLRAIEKDVMAGVNIKQHLSEIKNILMTPLKAYEPPQNQDGSSSPVDNETAVAEGDLPGQFTRLLGKLCTQLLVGRHHDDENCGIYLTLLERCLNHEAFNQKQKKLILSWMQQVQKLWHPIQKFSSDKARKGWGATFPVGQRCPRPQKLPTKQPLPPQWTFPKQPGQAPVVITHAPQILQKHNSLNSYMARNGADAKRQLERTHSAPGNWQGANIALALKSGGDFGATEPEINARLDSLCLSMTEHALGGMDGVDRGSTF